MSSAIAYHDQFVFVSNNRFAALLEFALEVGTASARSESEQAFVKSLREKNNTFFFNGYDLHIETEFPSRDERKFWSRVFFDVAHLIFHRKLGNQDNLFWQSSAIGDAYIVARMITRSVQEEELGWHPQTTASLEVEALNNEKFNVQF